MINAIPILGNRSRRSAVPNRRRMPHGFLFKPQNSRQNKKTRRNVETTQLISQADTDENLKKTHIYELGIRSTKLQNETQIIA